MVTLPNPVLPSIPALPDTEVSPGLLVELLECYHASTFYLAIDPSACKGCGACSRNCPAAAISGAPKQPYCIEATQCIKCNACAATCRFNAIARHAY